MQNVILVMNTQSYIINSVKTQLEEKYQVMQMGADIEELRKVKENISAILIYAEETLMENQQFLVYLKDRCIEADTPIFVLGDMDDIKGIEAVLPKHLLQRIFERPIDVKEVVREVDNYVQTYGNDNKKKILVVDDSGAVLRNIKGLLEDRYQVILANSGTMAIKYLTLNRPDLILLDYEMPVLDGRKVLEMIRTDMEFYDVPVIFLTSKSDKESVTNVLALKPEGYLLKSMKPEQIRNAIDEFFEKKKLSSL
ncbi:MAG: response regulator [Clostridiales bacterium]|nr:response regulator [Clostridiales bacterium]